MSRKEHIAWSESYSVWIKIIDDQHKALFEVVNDLFNHSTGNDKEERAYFTEIIQNTVHYIKEHLATEEKILLQAKYPNYAEHKKAHDEFIMTVIKSVKDYESGKRLVLVKLANFLRDWLLSHIGVMDRQYAVFFKENTGRLDFLSN
jgi:hemerythrin